MRNRQIFSLIFLFVLIFASSLNVSAVNLTDIDSIYQTDIDGDGSEEDSFSFKKPAAGENDMQFEGLPSTGNTEFWNKIFENYSSIIVFGSGAAMITFLGIFILNITKLNISSGNPEARKRCIVTLLWTGIATALLGGVTLLSAFSSGLFKA